MSQNPLVGSGAKSSQRTGLKPPLAAALASLEVQLDQELARYRRTRTGHRTFSQTHVGISPSSQVRQLTAMSTAEGKTQSAAEESLSDTLKKFGLATRKVPTPKTQEQEEPLVIPETKVDSPKSVEATQGHVPVSTTIPDTLLQPKTSQKSLTPSSSTTQQRSHNKNVIPSDSAEVQTIPTPNASIVPIAVKEQTQSENLAESQENTSQQPNDYLQSSEALLRSLAEEEPKTQKPTNSNDSLLSPLGIGSMLLLLLASLTLGYIVFNPKSLPQFSLNGLFKQNAPTTTESLADTTVEGGNNVKTVAQPTLTPMPKYPNLAIDEFPEVRDPNDVVSLKPKPKPVSTALPNPLTAQKPPNPVLVPNVQPPLGLNSAPPSTLGTTQKQSLTQQKLDIQIKPSADGFYHVVTNNQDERSFASARQIVPDAYLSSDGKLIYLGALKSKEKAQELQQQLQAKGLKVRIE
ncbi:hypothetical protein BZZ01_26220 [Nostocales cyanobacterium HT-58-2]|nr:hypothetical protein BZZ01_26220 [Nostocales cyanobacterium HT-58-2]